ncbi:arsenate reductase ArsC, partial [uncultured Microbulbifer sp.]|uniref:arsenate reductase ArsC n=1 Tax=uncultured Microbulbifer sp. TaxID=348147 RepID=UPI0025D174B4
SIRYLQERGIDTRGLQSQSWDAFAAEQPDVVVTVCDSAANESCPVWFGDTVKVHWGLPDPSKLEGSEAEIRQAFYAVMDTIEKRVARLRDLAGKNLSKDELQAALSMISEER